MNVAHVISSMGQESSGVQSYLTQLCNAMTESGVDVSVYTCGKVRDFEHSYRINTFPRKAFPIPALARSPELRQALHKDVDKFDIIHTNGLWQLPNIYPAQAIRSHNVKLITMPHGTCSRWALNRAKFKKRLFRWFGQDNALRRTDMFVATCEKEMLEIRDLGFKQPIAIIPIGINIPQEPINEERLFNKGRDSIVFLGRIHPVKGVDNLVRAWSRIVNISPKLTMGWDLIIAGPDCGAKGGLKQIIRSENIPNIKFIDELHGEAKYRLLREAEVYVLPSHTENFGITVAEALACGTPVISTKGTPWQGLLVNKCGWWIDDNVDTLTHVLQETLRLPKLELKKMGASGRRWMKNDFSWERVSESMIEAYLWLLGKTQRPNFVV